MNKSLVLQLHTLKLDPDHTDPSSTYICSISLESKMQKTPGYKGLDIEYGGSKFTFDLSSSEPSAVLTLTVKSSGLIYNTTICEAKLPISHYINVDFSYAQKHHINLFNDKEKVFGSISIKLGSILATQLDHNNSYIDYNELTSDEIFQDAEVIAKRNAESLERTMQLLSNTQQIGSDSLVELDRQGQKIEQFNRDVSRIKANMKESERRIRGIESLQGSLYNKVTSPFHTKGCGDEIIKKEAKVDKVYEKKVHKIEKDLSKIKAGKEVVNRTKTYPKTDAEASYTMQAEENETVLDDMCHLLDNLKTTAYQLGVEIDTQNAGLNMLNRDVDDTRPKLDTCIRKCHALVNK